MKFLNMCHNKVKHIRNLVRHYVLKRTKFKLSYEIHYNSYFSVIQSISINIYKIHNLIRVISTCPTKSVLQNPTFLRAEYINLTICACLYLGFTTPPDQRTDSHNILVSDLQTIIQNSACNKSTCSFTDLSPNL